MRLIENESRRASSRRRDVTSSRAPAVLDAITSSVEAFNRYQDSLRPDKARRTPWPYGGREEYVRMLYDVQEHVARNVLHLQRLLGRSELANGIRRLAKDPQWLEEQERR